MAVLQRGRGNQTKAEGFVSIATVLILMLVVATITVTVITVQIDNNRMYRVLSDESRARANADSCVEIALNKLKENSTYTGNETLNTDHGTCQIVGVAGTGNTNRVISVQGMYNNVTRKVKVTVATVNPLMSLTSWVETDTL